MSDSSQTWCMVPTEPASDCVTEAPSAVDESNAETMTALTNVAIEGEKDETYYWDTVKFSVEGTSFKVPRYQFVIGSTYFAGKLESTKLSENEGDEAPITLEGATASQFRVLLKLLFPIHTTSTTLKFSKKEWLVILELSTLWDFHEFRKLAKEHLERQLDDPIERIIVGRAAYIPRWVVEGYETLVTRSECITEQESERIGHLTSVRLYILRHERCFEPASVPSRFGEEVHQLEQMERDHISAEERRVEEEKRLEEERQRHDREEQQRLAEEKARAEREEEERKEREEMERREREERRIEEKRIAGEAYRKAEEERLKQERAQEERKRKEEEERRQKEEERLQMEVDEQNRKKEELRLEADRIAKELAALEKREEETRLQEEREREKREDGLEKCAEQVRRQRAREREERERVQKAERERLQQQSKAPSRLGGFESRIGSLFGGIIDIPEEQRSPPTQPWLDTSRGVNESALGWGSGFGVKKKPSISSIAKSTTGPTSLSRKTSQRSFQWGNAGATTTTSAFDLAAPVNNTAASLFGTDLQDINTANTALAAEQEKGTPPPPPLKGDENPPADPWDIEMSSPQKKAGEEPNRTLTPAPEEPVNDPWGIAPTVKKKRERKGKKGKSLLDLGGNDNGEDSHAQTADATDEWRLLGWRDIDNGFAPGDKEKKR